MSQGAPWVVIAVVLFLSTALQAISLVLSLAAGEPFQWRTLIGLATLLLGIFALRQARRSAADSSRLDK